MSAPRYNGKPCKHDEDEDHLVCAGCNECREDLNDHDFCPDCTKSGDVVPNGLALEVVTRDVPTCGKDDCDATQNPEHWVDVKIKLKRNWKLLERKVRLSKKQKGAA